jgi:methylated-DNA-[protein]-cysteine S-methyltransferase
MRIRYVTLDSPVGPLAVAWRGGTILAVHMEETQDRRGWSHRYRTTSPEKRMRQALEDRFDEVDLERAEPTARPVRMLARYFEGNTGALDRLEVDPGGTPFQAKVWERLRRIPAGDTMTYGEIAASVGHPEGARAAGGAVGSNPIPLVIPCHRVLAADGTLNGFGGGLLRKRWLLRHEGAVFRDSAPEQLRLL